MKWFFKKILPEKVVDVIQDIPSPLALIMSEPEPEPDYNTYKGILCAWCNREANIKTDGFHVAFIAFGTSQERHCFCSDECYEAFRHMYPSRVHRNCYERSCEDCNFCVKRYQNEAEGLRTLNKDSSKNPSP